MNTNIIEAIKKETDKDKVIATMRDLLQILNEESRIICDALKDKDKEFLIEILETQVRILHEDLRDIAAYIKRTYGVSPNDNGALEMIEHLMRDIEV